MTTRHITAMPAMDARESAADACETLLVALYQAMIGQKIRPLRAQRALADFVREAGGSALDKWAWREGMAAVRRVRLADEAQRKAERMAKGQP